MTINPEPEFRTFCEDPMCDGDHSYIGQTCSPDEDDRVASYGFSPGYRPWEFSAVVTDRAQAYGVVTAGSVTGRSSPQLNPQFVSRNTKGAMTFMANKMTTTPSPSLDDLLAENEGIGEWESDLPTTASERWLFPRYEGAEKTGYCDTKKHADLHEEIKTCKEWYPNPGGMYLSRSGIGHDTDVETLVAWAKAPRDLVGAILLLGEPGTGKTALIEAAVTRMHRPMTTVVCTPDHTKDSLFLRFVGEGKGDPDSNGNATPYTLGPIPYAAKHGHILYMDEFMLLMDGVKPLTYPLADGRRFLPEGNVDGSPMEIHPDFRLILSSNPLVRGASLPEPVASRCASTTITVETSSSMLHELGIASDIVAAWEALGNLGLFRPQIRELRLADHWFEQDQVEQAVSAFLPEHCPEAQRKDVRDTVQGFLGGDLRQDGRLVVQ